MPQGGTKEKPGGWVSEKEVSASLDQVPPNPWGDFLRDFFFLNIRLFNWPKYWKMEMPKLS